MKCYNIEENYYQIKEPFTILKIRREYCGLRIKNI